MQDLACATEIAKILNFSLIRCLLASIMALECMGLCTTAMSGTYELLYWPVTALGEPIRLACALGGAGPRNSAFKVQYLCAQRRAGVLLHTTWSKFRRNSRDRRDYSRVRRAPATVLKP